MSAQQQKLDLDTRPLIDLPVDAAYTDRRGTVWRKVARSKPVRLSRFGRPVACDPEETHRYITCVERDGRRLEYRHYRSERVEVCRG